MHSMMVCPKYTVYALPSLGYSGSQAGWASSVEKGVEPASMPRGGPSCWEQALQGIWLDTSILSTPVCCSCKPGDCNTPWALLPAFQM